MAKNDFPKVHPAEAYPLGHAQENKDASAYTGFKYPSGGGNDIGVYKQPMMNPNGDERLAVTKDPKVNGPVTDILNISVGGISKGNYKSNNPNGEKTMRGYGAATKGRKISGKQG
jgi:hypothetical protein